MLSGGKEICRENKKRFENEIDAVCGSGGSSLGKERSDPTEEWAGWVARKSRSWARLQIQGRASALSVSAMMRSAFGAMRANGRSAARR
jgi:hypothetical protein